MSTEQGKDKTVKELIEEHGKEARDRWREVFDEARARGADNDQALKIADDVVRIETMRGVLVPCEKAALDRAAREVVRLIDESAERDGKSIDPRYLPTVVRESQRIAEAMRRSS